MKIVKENLNELSFSKTIKKCKEGSLRKEEKDDGWWVMGEGHLISAKDEKDADEIIKKIKNES